MTVKEAHYALTVFKIKFFFDMNLPLIFLVY